MLMRRGREKIVVTAEKEPASERYADRQSALSARERMGTATDQALATVATTVVPALIEAREKLSPVAEQALAQGKIRGRQAAALGLVKGREAANAAKRFRAVEPPPEPEKSSHKLRNLILVLGLGGLGALAYKLLTGQDADPAWTAGRDSAAAPTSPVVNAGSDGSGGDSVPWGDTPSSTSGVDASAVDPVVAEPAGSDPVMAEMPATAGPIDGSATAPTAPLASEETAESPVPTTPDEPLERRDLS